jgi:hypothetical protein
LNISPYGNYGEAGMAFPTNISPSIRVRENKRLSKVKDPSRTMLLTDAKGFYVEYFDRGSSLNSMDLGLDDTAAGMLKALGRHGKQRDAWNIAMFDGSVRLLHFNQVPGTPAQYYSGGARLSPMQLITHADVPGETKYFWVGKTE